MPIIVDEHLKRALKEDIHYEDVTTYAVIGEDKKGSVELIAKQEEF